MFLRLIYQWKLVFVLVHIALLSMNVLIHQPLHPLLLVSIKECKDLFLRSLSKYQHVLLCLPLELQVQGDLFSNSLKFLLDDEPNYEVKTNPRSMVEQSYPHRFLDLLAQFQVKVLLLLLVRQA